MKKRTSYVLRLKVVLQQYSFSKGARNAYTKTDFDSRQQSQPVTNVLWCTVVLLIFFTNTVSFGATITYQYDALNCLRAVDYGNGFTETCTY